MYLADTSHLTAGQHGAYLLLIFHYWKTGKALPGDAGALSRIARMGEAEWEDASPVVTAFFARDESGGALRHARIEQEMARAREQYEKRKQASQHANATKARAQAERAHRSGIRLIAQPEPQPHSSDEEKAHAVSEKEAFEDFWNAYGRIPNASKPDARAAWDLTAAERPPQTVLLACVRAYSAHVAAQTRRDKRPAPVCHPATWLNGRRWESFLDDAREDAAHKQRAEDQARVSANAWEGKAAHLVAEIGQAAFAIWFEGSRVEKGPPVVIHVKRILQRDYIAQHYLPKLERLFGAPVRVEAEGSRA